MDFIESLEQIKKDIQSRKEVITTEEATKHAFILPFLQNVLGYNVFDPREVVPEFTSDVGTKKGEKVDYALLKDGKVQMIIECKKLGSKLNVSHSSQLYRYFHATETRIALLTNGSEYKFFTDLNETNKMDEKPFLSINLEELDPFLVPELKKMTKELFRADDVVDNAGDLIYVNEIKKLLSRQFEGDLDEDYLRFIASKFYEGKVTRKIRENFERITRKAMKQFLNGEINMRFESAMEILEEDEDVSNKKKNSSDIETTEEEIDAFNVIKAILRRVIDISRISLRDKKTYCGILLDENNRKPVCRLYFNSRQKYISLFDGDGNIERIAIDDMNDIFNYSEKIIETIRRYEIR